MVISDLCIRCKGKGLCGKRCTILDKFIESAPRPTTHFHGKSAPEVFVGRVGYPNVNSGILAPSENDNISNFPSAEEWSKNNFSIENVLRLRAQLIYGRGNSNIRNPSKLKQVTQELALSSRPVSTEIFLKKKPNYSFIASEVFSPMTNPAPIEKALLEENPFVNKKVDYLVSDPDVRATAALEELYKEKIKIDHLQKLLSVGLLGKKSNRKMVPTRWSITATDDIISKKLLDEIKHFREINETFLLSGNFVGNEIYVLFLPGNFSFEVMEFWMGGNFYAGENTKISQDYEGYGGRKDYASNVTGGYYAARIAVCEYLKKIQRQATVLVVRKITPQYYAPLGVGIVRECARRAMNGQKILIENFDKGLEEIQKRTNIEKKVFFEKSWLVKNYGRQKSLKSWF